MAQYIYKNTHFFTTMDPRRIIKNVLKGFIRRLRSYGVLFHDICCPVYFKFSTRGCDRKPPWETNLPKIMGQKSFNNYKPLNLNIHHALKR